MHIKSMAVMIGLAWVVARVGGLAATAQFIPLGILPGDTSSKAYGVSADGSVVVGASSRGLAHAFRWTRAQGMQALPTEPGHDDTTANAASADGTVIVGESVGDDGNLYAIHWTADGPIQFFSGLSEPSLNAATGVSADGTVAVGASYSLSGAQEAVIWTGDSAQGIGDLTGGDIYSQAWAITADGSVVVGTGTSALGNEAVRWTALGGLQGLGFDGVPRGVSADGSVLAGVRWYQTPAQSGEAFRWTKDDGRVGLGTLDGARTSAAFAIDATGDVIVGEAGILGPTPRAFIWTRANGMRELQSRLNSLGATNLNGWTLQRATGISSNGTHIVGYGRNPRGRTEAWLAVLPESGTSMLFAPGWVGGRFLIRVKGEPGLRYVIDASSDLIHWGPIWTNVAPSGDGIFEVLDDEIGGTGESDQRLRRFYRARTAP